MPELPGFKSSLNSRSLDDCPVAETDNLRATSSHPAPGGGKTISLGRGRAAAPLRIQTIGQGESSRIVMTQEDAGRAPGVHGMESRRDGGASRAEGRGTGGKRDFTSENVPFPL